MRLKYRVWHAFRTWICVCFTSCVWFNLWPIFVRRDFSGYISLKHVERNDFKASCNRVVVSILVWIDLVRR